VAAPKVVDGKVIVPGNSAPTWCGPKTDEMHYIDVYGCTAGATITLRVIRPSNINAPDLITPFACDASASTVQTAYGASILSTVPYPYSVHVDKSTVTAPSGISGVAAGTTGTRFTIGYWDPGAIMTNWWEPVVDSTGSASMTVVISTKQEGGYVNAVAKSTSTPNKPSVLQQVMSLFISNTSVVSGTVIGLTWNNTKTIVTASVTTTGVGKISNSDLMKAINTAAGLTNITGVASVSSKATAHGSTWNEYRITFAPSATTTYFKRTLAVSGLTTDKAFVTTYTNYNNYPWFYDYPYGYSGSGRYSLASSLTQILHDVMQVLF
jgi:hypothetical protein